MKKRFRSRKAQFTMYVILGMVLAAILGFAFYIRSKNVERDLEREADKILAEFLAKGIKNYIEDCLKDVTNEGIKRIGLQGGVLYDIQGGITASDTLILGEDFLLTTHAGESHHVYYGIKERNIPYPDAPKYPEPDTALADLVRPYFGRNALIKLCDEDGSNRIRVTAETAHTCMLDTYGDYENTVQGQLAEYVKNNIDSCVNLPFYLERAGHNISLSGDVGAGVIFSPDKITVNLTYPLTVKIKNSEPVQKTRSFSTTANVRLMRVYNLAYTLINRDVSDIFFNVSSGYNSLHHWTPGMLVLIAANPCQICSEEQGKYDNIIFIQDSNSDLKGEPFVFQFAVKNRRPALNLTKQGTLLVGDYLTVPILAIDPDDEPVTISFNGWRTDYITDPTCCPAEPVETYNDCLQDIDSRCGVESFDSWTFEQAYKGGFNQILSEADKGMHLIKITAADEAGFSDWQEDIEIFVG